jgi:hypothetical protein
MVKLSYEDFIAYCVKNVVKVFGEDKYEAKFTKVAKDDVVEHDSVQIAEKGIISGAYPSFRIKPFYEDYAGGKALGEVMLDIIKSMESFFVTIEGLNINFVTDFDKSKDKLIVRPISYTKNKKTIKDCFFKICGDIATVIYILISEKDDTTFTAKLPKETALDWGINESFLWQAAIENTNRMYPPFLVPFEHTINGKETTDKLPDKNKFFMNPLLRYELLPSMGDTYYLSIDKGINGAIAAFYPGVLDRLCQVFDDDLYLTFACIRDVIVHPVSVTDVKFVKKAAFDTSTGPYLMEEMDFLSSSAYTYTRAERTLRII